MCSGELDLTSLDISHLNFSELSGMTVLAVPCKIEAAAEKHGVYALEKRKDSYKVRDVVYMESAETLSEKKFNLEESKRCCDGCGCVPHGFFSNTNIFLSSCRCTVLLVYTFWP